MNSNESTPSTRANSAQSRSVKNSESAESTTKPRSSRLKGFYKLPRHERLAVLQQYAGLTKKDLQCLLEDGSLHFQITDSLVENAIGNYPMPLGLLTNLKMNGQDYVVPMAVEESSVIAAASNACKSIYESGGFQTRTLSSLMIGQIQILDVPVELFPQITQKIMASKTALIDEANLIHPRLIQRGGGVRDIEIRAFPQAEIPFLVLHFYIDTKDAMGANLINTICEKMAPRIERLTEARVGLRILSNYADKRLYYAKCELDVDQLKVNLDSEVQFSGNEVASRIVEAFVFADNDPYRATTHNKGIMNGIDPIVIATGNDWRAISAGIHAYASHTGHYRSLSKWAYHPKTSKLVGEMTLPLQFGTVGGVTKLNPIAELSLNILGRPTADTLSQIATCVGLASNLAALRALVTTGIQSGHMRLHAKNLALAAGAVGPQVDQVASMMIESNNINAMSAETFLDVLRKS